MTKVIERHEPVADAPEDPDYTGPQYESEPEVEGETDPQPKPAPSFSVFDNNTGEVTQMSLIGAQWEIYQVYSTRLSVSGGDEFLQAMLDKLVTGELSPGAIVEIHARGIVKEHAPIYTKGIHEGKTTIVLDVIRSVDVTGHVKGTKVEAALNVDGEPKDQVEDEVPVDEEPEPTDEIIE